MKQINCKLPPVSLNVPALTAVSLCNEQVNEPKFLYKYSYAEEYFSALYPAISDELRKEIRKRSFNVSLHKHDLLVSAGEINSSIYFIKKGLLRGFVRHGEEDITTWFGCENELLLSFVDFQGAGPVRKSIEALEPCSLEVISGEDLQWLYARFGEMANITHQLLTNYSKDAEEITFVARLATAKAKYKYLAKSKYNSIINRASLQYMASFMGMRKETLCRIRAEMVNKGIEAIEN